MFLMYCLGLCKHCGLLVTMGNRSVDGAWICVCGGELTCKNFGCTKNGEKIKWVGPDGKWTDEKPTEDFHIGDWHIVESRPSYHLYF